VRNWPVWFFSIALLIAPTTPVWADEPDACPELTDEEVTARLREVRNTFEHHEPDMRHWATAFLSLHLTMVAVQASLAVTADNEGAIVDGWVGTISSSLGVITMLISFPPLLGSGGMMDEAVIATPRDRRIALARAEQRFRRDSDAVNAVRGPVNPILNAVYLGGVGIFTLAGWQRVTGAFITSAGGSVLAQGRALLHPSGIRDAWRVYLRRYPNAACEPDIATAESSVQVNLVPFGLGAAISGTF
jgi:hypothetical protein